MTRMTSKGQVTIPKDVRDKLGIVPGSDIGFREEGGQMIIEPENATLRENVGVQLVRHLQEMGMKAKRIPMTSEALMELTRGPFNDLDAD
jgi:AbrB family looped-hinge helix DNA binding protein